MFITQYNRTLRTWLLQPVSGTGLAAGSLLLPAPPHYKRLSGRQKLPDPTVSSPRSGGSLPAPPPGRDSRLPGWGRKQRRRLGRIPWRHVWLGVPSVTGRRQWLSPRFVSSSAAGSRRGLGGGQAELHHVGPGGLVPKHPSDYALLVRRLHRGSARGQAGPRQPRQPFPLARRLHPPLPGTGRTTAPGVPRGASTVAHCESLRARPSGSCSARQRCGASLGRRAGSAAPPAPRPRWRRRAPK